MTEKLYYEDAYTSEFYGKVISSVKSPAGYDVVLDKTAFFPEEGGQYSDTGKLGNASVTRVYEENGIIHHICDKDLAVESMVFGSIDFFERYEKMQCHSAEHILSGLFYKHHGLSNVGFHLGEKDVTMDISAPLSREEIDKIEREANEIVYKNVEITSYFPKSEEISSLTYRSKLDIKENLRIVYIGDYDACACCAPHVKRSGEIGVIKILDAVKMRGGMRLNILAGRRAFSYFDMLYKNTQAMSELLSAPKTEVLPALENLYFSHQNIKKEYADFRYQALLSQATFDKNHENPVIYLPNASPEEMRALANELSADTCGYLVLISGENGNLKYVISAKNADMKEEIKKINSALSGRGGGKGNMAQGVFLESLENVSAYFKK